jgi:integrase
MLMKMPWYRTSGKIMTPIEDNDFLISMKNGYFSKRNHKGFIALLYYSAVRKKEALRSKKEQFKILNDRIIFEVGKRLKHGLQTPPLNIPLEAPYANEIKWSIRNAKNESRVWPYSEKTAYNIVRRVFSAYPHFFRLSRITNFFDEGWTIAQVRTWTGLSLKALDFYVGLVDVKRMGESLGKNIKKGTSTRK